MLAIDVECDPPRFKREDRMLITKGLFNTFGNLIRVGYDTDGIDSLGRTAEVLTLSASHSSVIDFIRTHHYESAQDQRFVCQGRPRTQGWLKNVSRICFI